MRPMISPWLAIVTVLACARLTRLITRDRILQAPRTALVNRWGIDSTRAYLLQCDWCTGMWVCAAIVPGTWWWGRHVWWSLPMAVLAGAHIVGFLASREEGE